jgi:hypothetical protein
VVLPVTFSTRENYRTEFIKFKVANFESSYHAILGRPALAKFIAVLHYVYLLLKMPGWSGVLTLRGDLKKSYDCNQEAIQYASTARVPDASGEVLAAAQQLSQAGLEIPMRKALTSQILVTFRTCASFTHKDDVQGQLFSERLDVFLPNSIWRLCATESGM